MELTAGESVFCRARFSLSLCSVVESASKQRRVPEPCDHHVRGVARALGAPSNANILHMDTLDDRGLSSHK